MQSTWWLASLGTLLVWARLDLHDSGIAQVFDSDGNHLTYESEDSARAALLDADFVAFDGIDADDAQRMGFVLGEVAPPLGASDEELKPRMMQTLHTER